MALANGEQSPVTSDLAARLREFILKRFPLARKHQIKNSDPLLESGMLDSMGVLEVVTFIEHEYSIGVSDEDLVPENFQNIDRIAAFIWNKTPRQDRGLGMK
jgi:acyl carrier protein